MNKINNNKKDYLNFKSNADQWWLENGKFEILHKINPIRIKYIINQILSNIKFKNRKKNIVLNKIKIIDVGCGGGLVCEPLSRLGADVVGVDFIKKNIKIAKKHAADEGLNINYLVKDINNINLKKKFDVLLLLEVIEHLDNWQKIIKKIDKLIKPNGLIIISSINRNFLSKIFALFIAEKILGWIPIGTHNYNNLIKPKELINVLKINNYKIKNISGMNYNPLTRNWNLSNTNTNINYFCSAQKTS